MHCIGRRMRSDMRICLEMAIIVEIAGGAGLGDGSDF